MVRATVNEVWTLTFCNWIQSRRAEKGALVSPDLRTLGRESMLGTPRLLFTNESPLHDHYTLDVSTSSPDAN